MAACALDEAPINSELPRDSDGIPEITLNITFPTPESPITRAISLEDENTIEHLYILVFHKDGDPNNLLDDTYAYTFKATPTGAGVDGAITDSVGGSSTNKNIKKVKLAFKSSPGEQQRFVLLANLPAALKTIIEGLNDSDVGTTTEQDIIEDLNFDASPWRTAQNTGQNNFTPFPMFGHMSEAIYIDYEHRDNIPSSIDINLIRSLARINVGVSSDAGGYGTTFRINRVYVCDANHEGYVAPHNNYLNTTPPDQPAHIGKAYPKVSRNGDFYFDFPASPDRDLSNTIYLPESDSLIVNGGATTNPPAFLVVQADLAGTPYYYRIDFTKDGKYVPLLRNHSYNIKILDIKTAGYNTLNEAKVAPPMTMNVSVMIEDGLNINNISEYNKLYLLGLSTTEVLFDWQGNWIGRRSGDNEYHEVNVLSTYTNAEWSASVTSGNFITATKASSTQLRIGTVSANKVNYTGEERSATVKITTGLITEEIIVRQTGGANSVVMGITGDAASKTAKIPLAFVSKARYSNIFSGKKIGDFNARVIWQEKGTKVGFRAKLIGNPGDDVNTGQHYIEVTVTDTTTNKYANALVALTWKNEGGVGPVGSNEPDQIVWSWHVWCMPEEDSGNSYGGYVNSGYHDPNQSLLMKRGLGQGGTTAAERGLYYQWGRKDPFMWDVVGNGPDSQEKADTLINFHYKDMSTVVDEAIKLPTTFFKNATDWLSATNNNLWDASGIKTYYDPCPEGWRIPLYYSDMDETPWKNDAVSYISTARTKFLNGYLHPSSADIFNDVIGYIWTASVNGNQARYTEITSGGLTFTGSAPRTSGYSVRCVKDLKRKF
ncbi:MAG: hypothetical protein LBD89_02910 [Tannerellaceae bacterium]|nr:hypothetical protein [Tannerellaceae bacterium]